MASQAPLPYVVDNLEKVPESLREYYAETEDGGSFRLFVDNVVPKEKFDEFRGNNTNLNKEKADLERQLTVYRTINEDADKLRQEYEELTKLRQRVKDKDLIEKDGFEKAVEQRTQEMKSASEGQIRALSEALNKREAELAAAVHENERIIISRAIQDAALASNAIPGAIPNILDQATREGWQLSDKKVPILVRNGEIVFGENGVDPLTPKEWASRTLRDSAPGSSSAPTVWALSALTSLAARSTPGPGTTGTSPSSRNTS